MSELLDLIVFDWFKALEYLTSGVFISLVIHYAAKLIVRIGRQYVKIVR